MEIKYETYRKTLLEILFNWHDLFYDSCRCMDCEVNMRKIKDAKEHYPAIPIGILEGLYDYINKGIPTGGFLYAVLCNNLVESFGRADLNSRAGLFEITGFIYNEAPSNCWGNKDKVNDWIDNFGRQTNETIR